MRWTLLAQAAASEPSERPPAGCKACWTQLESTPFLRPSKQGMLHGVPLGSHINLTE